MRVGEAEARMIARMADRYHVSESPDDVGRKVRKRVQKLNRDLTTEEKAEIERVAGDRHRHNIDMYDFVMHGIDRFGHNGEA